MAQPYQYVMKRGVGNTPMGRSYDFWQDNPWQNTFADATKNYGNLGNQYLGQYANMTPEQMRLKFGYTGGVGPDDSSLGRWTAQMRGNVGNELRQGANQMANAGVASTRGGMALPGSDLRSVLGQQANNQVAGMASQNFQNAVNYENQRRAMDNATASSLSNFAGNQMQTGLGLLGLQMQGLGAADQSLGRWQQNAGNAFANDTNLYNRLVESEPQRAFQQKQMRYQGRQMDQQQQMKDFVQNLIQQGFRGGNNTGDVGQFTARNYLSKLKGLGLLN
jgi:ribulose bisphosphate carboxylase small subunit